ncbi:MAG: hypothetical protein ACK401_08625, partial [Archaeoglobaceae archaeon]
KIVAIVLVASLVPLLVLAQLTILGISQFGDVAKEGVTKTSERYLTRAGQEVVKMKAEDLAKQITVYVRQKLAEDPKMTTYDLMNDPEFFRLAVQTWGANEYTWVGAGEVVDGEPRAVMLAHPTVPRQYLGLDLKYHLKWDRTMSDFYRIAVIETLTKPEAPQTVCGYVKWTEPLTNETVEKYLCQAPVSPILKLYDPVLNQEVRLFVGTFANIDSYLKHLAIYPAETI